MFLTKLNTQKELRKNVMQVPRYGVCNDCESGAMDCKYEAVLQAGDTVTGVEFYSPVAEGMVQKTFTLLPTQGFEIGKKITEIFNENGYITDASLEGRHPAGVVYKKGESIAIFVERTPNGATVTKFLTSGGDRLAVEKCEPRYLHKMSATVNGAAPLFLRVGDMNYNVGNFVFGTQTSAQLQIALRALGVSTPATGIVTAYVTDNAAATAYDVMLVTKGANYTIDGNVMDKVGGGQDFV